MIELGFESAPLDRLRARTQNLMSQEITDDNGLLSDLLEIGYLKQDITGYLGGMALYYGGGIEFCVDEMPGERGLTTNGGVRFHYESIHFQLIRDRDSINNALPYNEHLGYETGLVVAVDGATYYLDKSTVGLAWNISKRLDDFEGALGRACEDIGLAGEIGMDELVCEEYSRSNDTRSLARVIRVAAKWKERTLVPAYDPDARENLKSVLTIDQAREGLKIEVDGLIEGQVFRDIDIIRRVLPV